MNESMHVRGHPAIVPTQSRGGASSGSQNSNTLRGMTVPSSGADKRQLKAWFVSNACREEHRKLHEVILQSLTFKQEGFAG
jgi:hypothetical protein